MKSEFELIERFKKIIPLKMQGMIPIGDDTAVLKGPGGSKWLLTTDVLVEGVDFIYGRIAPEMAGRKAVAVNLSDIAAMGGSPVALVAAIGIPKGFSESWLEKFYKGMTATAQKHKTLFAGGDISRSKEFFASIAMIGLAPVQGPRLRSGARPGDWIGVTGTLGGSILKHHYAFEPRIPEGHFIVEAGARAMIDISDGFAQDLGHILKASNAGAEIEIRRIPISRDAVKLVKSHPRDNDLAHALNDGEDFELLFTIGDAQKQKLEKSWPKQFPKTRLSWLGRIRKEKGLRWLDHGRPVRLPFATKGFRHF